MKIFTLGSLLPNAKNHGRKKSHLQKMQVALDFQSSISSQQVGNFY